MLSIAAYRPGRSMAGSAMFLIIADGILLSVLFDHAVSSAIKGFLDEKDYMALQDNDRVCHSFLGLFIAIYNSLWCSGYSRHMETDNSR